MKAIHSLLLVVISGLAFSQNGVLNISIKDSETGVGIKSEVIVNSGMKEERLFTSDYGKIVIEGYSGRCDLSILANGYKRRSTQYFLSENKYLNVDILLEPEELPIYHIDNSRSTFSGHVVNKEAGSPLSKVRVVVAKSSKERSITNQNGKYQVTVDKVDSLEDSADKQIERISLTFKKKGFKKLVYSNIPLTGGEMIFNIELSPGSGTQYKKYYHKLIDDEPQIEYDLDYNNDFLEFQDSLNRVGYRMPVGCPSVDSIRIGTNCPTRINANGNTVADCTRPCTTIVDLSIEDYVKKGVGNEWVCSWNDESLKAGAVAYRTYGTYFVLHTPQSNWNAGYHIRGDECNQAYTAGVADPDCANAAMATIGEVLVDASNQIVKSEFSRENNNYGNCGDGWAGCTNCGSPQWPCIQDAVCFGIPRDGNSHWRGMCTWGSHRWASAPQNKLYTWILDHYYNPGGFFRCNITATTNSNLSKQTDTAIVSGNMITINATIVNNGTENASSSFLGYYASTDTIISTSDYLIGIDTVTSLLPGDTVDQATTIDICLVPGLPAGVYHFGYIIDYLNSVIELNENDNSWMLNSSIVSINQTPPQPNAISGSTTVCEGSSETYSIRSVNGATGYTWTLPLGWSGSSIDTSVTATISSTGGTISVTADSCGSSSPATLNVTVNNCTPSSSFVLQADTVPGTLGTQVLVPVRVVSGFTNIGSLQGTIEFNTAVITFAQTQQYGIAGLTSNNFGISQAASGKISFSWSDANGITLPNGTVLFVLVFNVATSAAQSSAISFTGSVLPVEIADSAFNIINGQLNPGRVNVNSKVQVTGKVHTVNSLPVSNVTLTATCTGTATTYASGGYTLLLNPGVSCTVAPFKNSDANKTCGVTTLDVLLTRRHILDVGLLASPYNIIAADANMSNSISTIDLLMMQSFILNRITYFPGGRLWRFIPNDFVFASPTTPFPYDTSRSYASVAPIGDQDYVAVKIGDVNNSCTPTLKDIRRTGQLVIEIPDVAVADEGVFEVPLLAKKFDEISGLQFTITWDARVMEFVALNNRGLAPDFNVGFSREGMLTVLWADENAGSETFEENSPLFSMTFRNKAVTAAISAIEINSEITPVEAVNNNLELVELIAGKGTVTVTDEFLNSTRILTIAPNPFRESTSVDFQLQEDETVQMSVYNILGEKVNEFKNLMEAGHHRLVIDRSNMKGGTLPAGTYFVEFSAGQYRRNFKVVCY